MNVQKVNKKLKEIAELVERAHSIADELYLQVDEWFENKSEKWKESDKGESWQEIVNDLETYCDYLTDCEAPEIPDDFE